MKSELLTLDGAGSFVRVSIEPEQTSLPEPPSGRWFSVNYEVRAHPFSGNLGDTLLLDDLKKWHDQLAGFAVPGTLQLGSNRAATLQLHVDEQVGGTPGHWAVEVRLMRSEDDPWPEIRFLIFGLEPFTTHALGIVTALLREHS